MLNFILSFFAGLGIFLIIIVFISLLLLFLLISFIKGKLISIFGGNSGKGYYQSNDDSKVIIDAEAIQETFIEEYISKIKNVSLGDDAQMKEAIENLIIVLSNIDLYLSKHSEKSNDFREIADFYLPEIITNLHKYSEVIDADYNSESKERLRSSLLETLNLVANAFSTILNELYDNIALNVSASLDAVKASIRMKGLSR